MAVLKFGLDSIREKLFLASRRQTTCVEDIAYSLLGIFNAAIPVIYGEGTRSVGRLLEHLLTNSGDITILAWTGTVNQYNSCLPTDLTAYHEVVPLHILPLTEIAQVDRIVTELRSYLLDLSKAKHHMISWSSFHHLPLLPVDYNFRELFHLLPKSSMYPDRTRRRNFASIARRRPYLVT